jgi:glycosyltransferase involved in cell wall biosynthesis
MPRDGVRIKCLHITRFNRQKNSELLLDICEALRKSGKLEKLQVVVAGEGDGDARSRFEEEVRQRHLADTIQCVGHVSDVRPLLSSAHCLLSTSRWEGQPLGVLEAMAMARCVVATDVVGHRGVVRSGTDGLLFPDGDASAAAKALLDLMEQSVWMESLALAARRKWEARYSIDALIARRVSLYQAILSGG